MSVGVRRKGEGTRTRRDSPVPSLGQRILGLCFAILDYARQRDESVQETSFRSQFASRRELLIVMFAIQHSGSMMNQLSILAG